MDVLQLLKKDHKMVKEMFAEFESMAERSTQKKPHLVLQVCQALTVHAQVEEEVFYPALYKVHSKELTALLDEAAEEHQVAKTLIAELEDLQPEEARHDAKVTVLGEYVLHHVKEEEKEMFKLVKQHLSKDELAALGEQVEARRNELMMEEGEDTDWENFEEGEEKDLEKEEEEESRVDEEEEDAEEQDMKRRRGGQRAA